jgi:hypothetical protein
MYRKILREITITVAVRRTCVFHFIRGSVCIFEYRSLPFLECQEQAMSTDYPQSHTESWLRLDCIERKKVLYFHYFNVVPCKLWLWSFGIHNAKHAVSFVRYLDTFAVKTKRVGRRLHKVLGFVNGFLTINSFTQFMTITGYHSASSNRTNAPNLLCYARISYPISFCALPSLVLPTSSSFLSSSSSLSLYLLSFILCTLFLVFSSLSHVFSLAKIYHSCTP